METSKTEGKQLLSELIFILPADCALVLILLLIGNVTGQLSVQSIRMHIRKVITPQVRPFREYTRKIDKFEWVFEGKGLAGAVAMKRKCVSQLNTAWHPKQSIDLLFRIHAGQLLVIKHSAAKINKRCVALNLAASKSYSKTTTTKITATQMSPGHLLGSDPAQQYQ